MVECQPCVVCGKAATLEVPLAGLRKWQAGTHAQDAFPEIPPPVRELLITGTHPECWEVLWKEEDE